MNPGLKSAGRIALAMCMVLFSHISPAAAVEIDVATAYAADNFRTQNLQQYANDVAKATTGQINFKIHPAGTLTKPTENLTAYATAKRAPAK